jgi:hypothetical protein
MVKNWIGIPSVRTMDWSDDLTLAVWWTKLLKDAMTNRMVMATIIMIVNSLSKYHDCKLDYLEGAEC